MAKNDWAIVVGIQSYFDSGSLGALAGPENDAREFFEWVTSSAGGNVPEGQATLILSSDYKPPFANIAEAMPTREAIKNAFDHLNTIAQENNEKELGFTVGDRLYIFMAGHGFAPDIDDELTALLTAEASVPEMRLNHVIGSYMADQFWRAAFFKQVLLFMDCCRSVLPCSEPFRPYKTLRGRDYDKLIRFYAYGARVAQESREWTPPGGKCHGVFTMTLLNGLRGAAYDLNDPKHITGKSLNNYLYNGFKTFVSPADRTRPMERNEPEVKYEQKPDSDFVVADVPPTGIVERVLGAKSKKFPVRILASAPNVGRDVEIQDWQFKPVTKLTLAAANQVELERGFFTIVGTPSEIRFEVTGSGGLDVAA
jgi:uncharacterized caspase-like protein